MSAPSLQSAAATAPLTLYSLPTCGTCRNAIAALRASGCAFQIIDLRAYPPDLATLSALISQSGLAPKAWFNTSGQSYRAGGWAAQAPTMTAAAVAEALAADPMLIKRPVAVAHTGAGPVVRVGFHAARWAEAGLLPAVRP